MRSRAEGTAALGGDQGATTGVPANALLRLQRAAGNRATAGLLLSVQRDAMTRYEDKDWHAAAWVLKDFPHDKAIARVKGLSASRRNRLAEGAMHSPEWRETVLALVEAVDKKAALIGRARYHLWKRDFLAAVESLVKLDDATIRTIMRQRYGTVAYEDVKDFDIMVQLAGSVDGGRRIRYLFLSGPELPRTEPVTFMPKNSGALARSWLLRDPVVGPYAKAKWPGRVGPVTLVADDKWVGFAASLNPVDPMTGASLSRDEARHMVAGWDAFTDPGTGRMYFRHVDYTTGTVIHELVHALAGNGGFSASLGFHANEGTTEYFARRVARTVGVTEGDNYLAEFAAVKALIDAIGEHLVAAAFFGDGQTDGLAAAVTAKFPPRPVESGRVFTRWEEWTRAVTEWRTLGKAARVFTD